jgi:DNA-binding GntR family transcriptional regulator
VPPSEAAIHRDTLADQIVVSLRAEIEDGRRKAGSYVSIADLAKAYGTSRTPVHEACVRLMQWDLVELVEGKGVHILGTSGHDVEDIFQIRLWLEAPAAREAVERRYSREDKERLRAKFEEMMATVEAEENANSTDAKQRALDAFWRTDHEFHHLIHEASGNDRLATYLRRLRELTQLREVVVNALLVNGVRLVAELHRPILEAIEAGDPELAWKAMRDHIQHTAEVVAETRLAGSPRD